MREGQENEIRRNTAVRMCRMCGLALGEDDESDVCFACRGRPGEGREGRAEESRGRETGRK